MQANRIDGTSKRFTGSLDCYKHIIKSEGVGGLWRGWTPNVIRNPIVNAAELASFDQYKEMVLRKGLLNDNIICHLTCASLSGITACVFASPIDVVKARIMSGVHKNPVQCIKLTY
mmetsp:Transcript_7409/g.12515  ORF Transcript_7409/g.12515 Transcript_7409/m.12515 type:complete len:116 (-) Transcript_7409:114-461(-)